MKNMRDFEGQIDNRLSGLMRILRKASANDQSIDCLFNLQCVGTQPIMIRPLLTLSPAVCLTLTWSRSCASVGLSGSSIRKGMSRG